MWRGGVCCCVRTMRMNDHTGAPDASLKASVGTPKNTHSVSSSEMTWPSKAVVYAADASPLIGAGVHCYHPHERRRKQGNVKTRQLHNTNAQQRRYVPA